MPEGLRVAVFGRHEKTAASLRQMGMKFVRLGTVEPGAGDPVEVGVDCLIVGAQGLDLARFAGEEELTSFIEVLYN